MYKCSVHGCKRTFRYMSSLKHHRLVHADVRDHECPACGKTCRTRPKLVEHMSVHRPAATATAGAASGAAGSPQALANLTGFGQAAGGAPSFEFGVEPEARTSFEVIGNHGGQWRCICGRAFAGEDAWTRHRQEHPDCANALATDVPRASQFDAILAEATPATRGHVRAIANITMTTKAIS
jgi:hypothetical protein